MAPDYCSFSFRMHDDGYDAGSDCQCGGNRAGGRNFADGSRAADGREIADRSGAADRG